MRYLELEDLNDNLNGWLSKGFITNSEKERLKKDAWVHAFKFTKPEQKEEFVNLYYENLLRDYQEQQERHEPLDKAVEDVEFKI